MEIREGYVKKCLENWHQIVGYIEDRYKDYLITEDTIIFCDNCGSDDEDEWFKICINTEHSIILHNVSTFNGLSFYFNGQSMLRGKYPKNVDMIRQLQDFCYGVMVICNNWEKIKSNIECDIKKYQKVMDFKI